jgi:hypothetical protein
VIEMSLPIPSDFPEGTYDAVFCDLGNTVRRTFRNDPSLLEPRDLVGLLRAIRLQTDMKRTTLFFHVPSPERGISVQGQSLPNLPGSVRAVFASKREIPLVPIRSDLTRTSTTPWVVEGLQTLHFTVAKDPGLSLSLDP